MTMQRIIETETKLHPHATYRVKYFPAGSDDAHRGKVIERGLTITAAIEAADKGYGDYTSDREGFVLGFMAGADQGCALYIVERE